MRGLARIGVGESVTRIFHTWDEWECYPAGFYENRPPSGITPKQAIDEYSIFLRDLPRFESALQRVLAEWPNSCEHYLSNESMNRIAWLGQASLCIDTKIPATFRAGFGKLSEEEKRAANLMALKYLNVWLKEHGESELTMETSKSRTKADLY